MRFFIGIRDFFYRKWHGSPTQRLSQIEAKLLGLEVDILQLTNEKANGAVILKLAQLRVDVDKFTDSHSCAVQREIFTDPVKLKACPHTFEEEAIKAWVKHSKKNRICTCPTCRARFVVKPDEYYEPNDDEKTYIELMLDRFESELTEVKEMIDGVPASLFCICR